ncbi:tetratricopeptide repeat protein [Pontivivens nitratireducens]|uniref:Tetratricopeptide repeat protein n=1 Tax=Pontivivens nitratireducens TaxID=2758038 RepID=A0A6G7VKK1_9RHOB|nr:tetratricopeptide repeat protein [Pontibrevibacter nitratireducens]QIK40378.1 tetratricopeptide repeat protein [Pontibrevibacter nitratireducens]
MPVRSLFAFATALSVLLPTMVEARSLSGSYLAAAQAELRDDHVNAALYYTRALGYDGEDTQLLQRAMQAQVSAGRVGVAASIAERLLALNSENQFATLVAITHDIRRGDPARALARLDQGEQGMTPLLAKLLRGWLMMSLGDEAAALDLFDAVSGNETYEVFAAFHSALALALTGQVEAASRRMEGGDAGPVRLNRRSTQARIQLLAATGQKETALAVADDVLATGFGDRPFEVLRTRIEQDDPVQFDLVQTPDDGIAEVLFDLASVLGEEGADVALIYSRLAAHIQPDFAEAQLLVATVLNEQGQYTLATDAFDAVPSTSPQFVEAELGRMQALASDGRQDDAIAVLAGLTRAYPDSMRLHYLHGDTLRRADRPAEAIEAFDMAVSLLGEPSAQHWLVYYQRAVAHHNADNWAAAEADLRRALELEPDNALVLNYLGYSLVEEKRDLDAALEMIRRAVDQRPYEGYITDSLGWVLYRLGRFEEAIEPMERAVELAPVDPLINDHLGDVYWAVGRKREAEFQWKRALSFEPEPEEETRIRLKLDIGLDAVLAQEAAN